MTPISYSPSMPFGFPHISLDVTGHFEIMVGGLFSKVNRQSIIIAVLVAPVLLFTLYCRATEVPDLPSDEAAKLLSQAPEFNRYARLVSVGALNHPGDSMQGMAEGEFTFRYLNAPSKSAPIQADAQFSYWDGAWHLGQFSYGCPGVHLDDCRIVHVYNDPPKEQ